MTLRGRLLFTIVLLNAALVGVVQLGSAWVHRQRSAEQREMYDRLLKTLLADAAGPDRPDQVDVSWMRKLIGLEDFRRVFEDVLVTTGGVAGKVDLNPMGAVRRDLGTFPLTEIRRGIQQAMTEQRALPVARGFAVPIQAGGRVVAGAWYVPVDLPAVTPFGYFAVPVLLSTVVMGVVAYLGLGRSVVRPLIRLGRAAGRVGAGEHDVRVERVQGAPEIDALVDAFNAMAAKVAGHTEELEREVQRATEETQRRERALLVSSRLAAMGTLAAGIAHEINNPIGGMINAVHRLQQRTDLDERSRVYLQLVREGLDRIGAIARRVLDFSPRDIHAAPFELRKAIDGAQELVDHRCRRQFVDLVVDVPDDLPRIVGDRHEIQQVLLNCFINSLDVLEDRRDGRIIVTAERAGASIHLRIDDNGPGADPATLGRVMDPFFSNKGRPDASGLGLFISYSIIRNHGGDMQVRSQPGNGFHIEITLPAAVSEAAAGDGVAEA